jgi:hypothetical protein
MEKEIRYKGLESAMISDAVRKLPKGHNWGTVRLEIEEVQDGVNGHAECLDCGQTICCQAGEWMPFKWAYDVDPQDQYQKHLDEALAEEAQNWIFAD